MNSPSQKDIKWQSILDMITALTALLLIIPLIYILSIHFNNIWSFSLLILLSAPTIMTTIYGAPFVPTPMERARQMVAMAKLKKGQRVYDLGCGDGRFVYLAANEYGAKATGIELSPIVYLWALIRKFFWKSKAVIKFGNFKSKNLNDAEIIFCYLLPETLRHIQPSLDKKIRPGTKIYSYAFEIPNWKLIHKEERNPKLNLAPVYVYEKI